MEKTVTASKAEADGQEVPLVEPNGSERTLTGGGEEERTHTAEPERVIEWGGPGGRYGKLNIILGKGAYKVVWKAIDKEEGIEVAWNSCQTTRSEFNEFAEEVEILKKVRHQNIITFHDSWYANGEFIFITELMTSGTLREYIRAKRYVKKFKNPSIKIIRRWARQILKGLLYLHSNAPPIIHRDIKCDNLFINGSHGEVKIGDMGTAKMRFGKKYTVIGTPEFMAPEMYEEKGYSEKVDIYAFGMCLLEMVTGEYPYSECKNAAQIYKKVTLGVKPDCLAKIQDKEVLALINSCLVPEHERWSAKKLIDHPFLLEDPEVILLAANENRTRLKLQVLFKGHDKHTIKFEYNRDTDTAEEVVREMIQEKILDEKYQGLVCNEIHRILRDLSKNIPPPERMTAGMSGGGGGGGGGSAYVSYSPTEVFSSENRILSSHRRTPSEAISADQTRGEGGISIPSSDRSRSRPRQGTDAEMENILLRGLASISVDSPNAAATAAAFRRNSISNMDGNVKNLESFDSEGSLRDYPNEMSIEDFVSEIAAIVNRPAEKAADWTTALKNQDLMTVGDLRDLLDDDWTKLNLTVFASRVLKNAIRGAKLRSGLEMLSPRVSGRISEGNIASLQSHNPLSGPSLSFTN